MNSCDEMMLCVNQTDESTPTSVTSAFSSSSENTTSNDTLWMNLFELIKQRPLAFEERAKNVIIITCYSLIVIISLIGNLMVMKVILFGKKKMLTTTNILIASLAFSDIVMTALNIPFNVARLLLDHWPFGQILCVLVPFIQVSCVYVSTFTMAIIAYHRWKILSQPLLNIRRKISNQNLILIILSTWFLAGLLSIPHSVFNREVKRFDVIRCRVVYPELGFEFDWRKWLTIEALLTQYLIPLSITCYLYIKIGLIVSYQSKLAMRLQNHLNHYCNGKKSKQNHFDKKRKRIIMLILVVVIFAVCWLPLNLYHLLNDFKLIRSNFRLFLICHWFAMSSVCYNPFIYCWLNESFKKGARKFINTFLKCILIDKMTKQRTDSLSDSKHLNAVNIEVEDIQNEEEKSSGKKQIFENPIYNHMEIRSQLIIHQQNELTSTSEINGDQSLENLTQNKVIATKNTLIVQIEMNKFDCELNTN